MSNFKKVVASVSAAAIVLAQNVSLVTFAATWNVSYYQDAYDFAKLNGLTSKDSVESFDPLSTVKREAGSRFFSMFGENVVKTAKTVAGVDCAFSDMAMVDPTLTDFVGKACSYGYMKGSNGKFMWKDDLTRGAAITVVSRILDGNKYDNNSADYRSDHATNLMTRGIITKVNASEKMLRGDLILVLKRVATMSGGSSLTDLLSGLLSGSTTTGTTTPSTVVKAGDVTVSLSPTSAPSRNVPAVGIVPAGTFRFQAGSSDITVNAITVKRKGLGNQTDIYRLYLEKDGMRISGKQSLGYGQESLIAVSPAIVIKAGTFVDVDLIAVMNGVAGGNHMFSVEGVNAVDSSAATVNGARPVMTNAMTTSNYSVLSSLYSVTANTNTYKVGDTAAILGQFRVLNNDANKAGKFLSVTFRNDGTGDPAKNISNLVLKRNGTTVSSKVTFNQRYVTFLLNDPINPGVQANYDIQGDVIGVDNATNDTYQFRLQYAEDMNLVESDTMFKSNLTGSVATAMGTATVQWGDVILSKNTSTLTTQTLSAGMQDAVLMDWFIDVKQAIRLTDLSVSFNTTAGTGEYGKYIQVLKLMIGNRIVSTYNPSSTDSSTVVFAGTFDVTAKSPIKVLATIRSTFPASTPSPVLKLNDVSPSNFATKEYVANGNPVTTIAGSIQGISSTVGAVNLTVTKNDGLANQQVVRGTSNKLVFAVNVRTTDVAGVKLNSLRFRNLLSGSTSFNSGWASLVNLTLTTWASASSNAISTKNLDNDGLSGAVTFNNMGQYYIPMNSSQTFYVRATFQSVIATGSNFQLAFGTSDVQGTDDQGNSLSNLSFSTVNSSVFTLRDVGSLNVQSDGTVNSRQLLGPNASSNVFSVRLTAQDDDIRITDLYLSFTGVNKIDNNRISAIQLLSETGVVLKDGSVFTNGVRFDFTDSSNEIISQGMGKTYLVKVMLNAPTDSGAYSATGLMLILGTGGIVANEVKAGTVSGVRALSVNGQTVVPVVATSVQQSQQHTVTQSAVMYSLPTGGHGFNGATVAYKFTITPTTAGWQVQLNNVKITCSYAGTTVGSHLMRGDVNTYNDLANQMNTVAQNIPTATQSTITVATPANWRFNGSQTFTVALTAAMGAWSKTCVINDIDYTEVFANGSTRTVGTTNVFGNIGFNSLIPATLQ